MNLKAGGYDLRSFLQCGNPLSRKDCKDDLPPPPLPFPPPPTRHPTPIQTVNLDHPTTPDNPPRIAFETTAKSTRRTTSTTTSNPHPRHPHHAPPNDYPHELPMVVLPSNNDHTHAPSNPPHDPIVPFGEVQYNLRSAYLSYPHRIHLNHHTYAGIRQHRDGYQRVERRSSTTNKITTHVFSTAAAAAGYHARARSYHQPPHHTPKPRQRQPLSETHSPRPRLVVQVSLT